MNHQHIAILHFHAANCMVVSVYYETMMYRWHLLLNSASLFSEQIIEEGKLFRKESHNRFCLYINH